jgi:hypothetical protein
MLGNPTGRWSPTGSSYNGPRHPGPDRGRQRDPHHPVYLGITQAKNERFDGLRDRPQRADALPRPVGRCACLVKSGRSLLLSNIADRTIEGADTAAHGATGGASARNIATGNLPAHSHTINHGHAVTDPGHNDPSADTAHSFVVVGSGPTVVGSGGVSLNAIADPGAASHATGFTVDNYNGSSSSIGNGTALDTTPAHLALNAIIKAH